MTAPFLPAWYDMAWTVVALAGLVLSLVALLAWWRSPRMVGGLAVVWAVVILALPVIGPVFYLTVGRGRRQVGSADATSR